MAHRIVGVGACGGYSARITERQIEFLKRPRDRVRLFLGFLPPTGGTREVEMICERLVQEEQKNKSPPLAFKCWNPRVCATHCGIPRLPTDERTESELLITQSILYFQNKAAVLLFLIKYI